MNIRILFLGEIVGRPGIHALKDGLKTLKESQRIDFVVANGEGTTNGFGIGKNHALQIMKLGVDLITTGEKTYYKKDMVEHIGKNGHIIRPANYPAGNPGRGYRISISREQKSPSLPCWAIPTFPARMWRTPTLRFRHWSRS